MIDPGLLQHRGLRRSTTAASIDSGTSRGICSLLHTAFGRCTMSARSVTGESFAVRTRPGIAIIIGSLP